LGQHYDSDADIHTFELQQIFQQPRHTLVAGGRAQFGEFDTHNKPNLTDASLGPYLPDEFLAPTQHVRHDFDRLSAYGYYHLHVGESLTLIGGVSFDHLMYPENFRYAPLTAGERTADQISPKAGLLWTPRPGTTVRAAYSQALGGVAYDQSFQLEPTQIAGFNQAYRSIIPDAVTGANAAPRFEIAGLAVDQKFSQGTYFGVGADWLRSQVHRTFGVYQDDSTNIFNPVPFIFPSSTRQHFDYEERSFTATLNQLLGKEWSLGAVYRLSKADLTESFPGLGNVPGFDARSHQEALMHRLYLSAIYTHPSGFFGQGEAIWTAQELDGGSTDVDNFWQFNLWAGYRFWQRRVEVRLGVVNLTDRSYHLNPLNVTLELPHERSAVASLRFSF
jgi:hypothetical protein